MHAVDGGLLFPKAKLLFAKQTGLSELSEGI